MIRRLIVPLTVALATFYAGQGFAQGAFPAPLPGRAAAAANDPAFPPVNGMAPTPSFGAAPSSFPATARSALRRRRWRPGVRARQRHRSKAATIA
jgi:hypothetical protein